MFREMSYRALVARLVKRHGLEPAAAHLLARACHPPPAGGDGGMPAVPRMAPKQVTERVDIWELTKQPPLGQLLTDIFGDEQMATVEAFIRLNHRPHRAEA